MQVYLSSTASEMSAQRAVAERAVRDLGWGVVAREPREDGRETIGLALSAVDDADLLLAIVGWTRGPVAAPETGGDGVRPWADWEVRRALENGRPAIVLLASEAWPDREEDPEARSAVADLRGELHPLAVTFDPEPGGLARFERLVREQLADWSRSRTASEAAARPSRPPSSASSAGLSLRAWPRPELPEHPWPVLLPCSHPDLLAGRDSELEEVVERLERPTLILGLHGASGAGKSSLLAGGLVPALRAAGRAAALDRHPAEPGLATRLVGDLLAGPEGALAVADADHATFVDRLLTARRRSGDRPAILVLDQFEQVLRAGREARAAVGVLLAATAQRRPGVAGPVCRWLLGYRRELHGELLRWLGDPLREARALGCPGVEDLPHALASLDRFHAWPLPPLGTAPAHTSDAAGFASRTFLAAILAPLAPREERGRPRYPWRFEGDGAERLARAFGQARVEQPAAPLTPELQVVLAHLVEAAGEPAVLVVPDDPGRLIDDALEEHLARALDAAFPATDRTGRARALLALRELADAEGRRGGGRSTDDLVRSIGRGGREALEKLQAPQCRLVVAERRGDDLVFTLSHDRLAEVVVRAVGGAAAGGRLAVDPGLLARHRFVALHTELFRSGEEEQATRLSGKHVAGIAAHAETLLADDERRQWWRACLARRRAERRRKAILASVAAALVLVAGWAIWAHVNRRASREALLAEVGGAEPEAALAALARGLDDRTLAVDELRGRLRQREAPLDVLESGMGAVPEPRRGEVVLEVAELAVPLLSEAPGDTRRLATLLWALDHAPGRTPALAARARALEDRALAPVRKLHPPPVAGGDGWVAIPAGTFRMGSSPEEEDAFDNEMPAHEVTISAFRTLDHEVTNAEYRRLHPDHPGEGDLPATSVTWYSAYVYSAWLGGRLPTEAEWEHMARAGCRFERCRRDGEEATVEQVAWTWRNARDPSGQLRAHPIRRLEPNPWGVYDLLGNVWEWVADWYGAYGPGGEVDPWGPPLCVGRRVVRGGCYWDAAVWARPAYRDWVEPEGGGPNCGFRPVLPAAR